MKNPFFSIVIPTFNEEELLPRLLDDLHKQSEKDFEVFVIDGGSSDQTVSQAQKFAQKLPLTIIDTEFKNVSRQRNYGAKSTRGEYLIFFDADVQLPRRFLLQLKEKLQNEWPDFATTYGRADSTKVYDRMIARAYNLSFDISLLLERPIVIGFNFIVKKKVFEKSGGFRPEIVHGEDHELAERLYRMGYQMTIFKKPRLIFSLRRFRKEGRLEVLRKNAKATIHVLTRGHITEKLFAYPMGGGWYRDLKSKETNGFEKVESYFKKMVKLLFE